VAPAEREKLLRTWSRVNVLHLAVLGVAWLAASGREHRGVL
jgi:hypothetical protein